MLQELCIGLASIIRAKCSWGSGKRSVQSLWPRSLELLSLRWVQIAFIQGYATLRSIHLIKLHQPVLTIIVSESSQLEWPRSGKPRRFGEANSEKFRERLAYLGQKGNTNFDSNLNWTTMKKEDIASVSLSSL